MLLSCSYFYSLYPIYFPLALPGQLSSVLYRKRPYSKVQHKGGGYMCISVFMIVDGTKHLIADCN